MMDRDEQAHSSWHLGHHATVTNNYGVGARRIPAAVDGRSDLPGGGAAPALLSTILLGSGAFAVLASTGASSFYVASRPAQWNVWLFALLGVTAALGTVLLLLSLVFRMQRTLLLGAALAEVRDLHEIARSGGEDPRL